MRQRKIAGNNRIGGNSPAVTVPAMQADKDMMSKAKNTLNRLMKQAGLKSNNKANAAAKMNNTRMGGRRTRKHRKKRGGVGKKGYSHPKRGQKSRTRKGNKDFTTKKGNKVLIQNGGGGGAVASPIAGDIVEYYINSSKFLAEN